MGKQMIELSKVELDEVNGGVSWAGVGVFAGRVAIGVCLGVGVGAVIGLGAYLAYEAIQHNYGK